MNPKHFRWIFFILFGIALFAQALADTGEKKDAEDKSKKEVEQEAPRPVETVVVVAKRVPEDFFKTDRSVSLLLGELIREQSPRTTPEALFDASGVFVQQTNHGGGSPILRGMVGPQVLISVDGVRFNNSLYRTGPVQYLNLLDPLALDRIEVLRGPGSVPYGSDAMGGVIRVDTIPTPHPSTNDFQISGNLLTRYQSADSGSIFHGGVSTSLNGWSFVGSFSKKHFENLRGGGDAGVQAYSGYDGVSSLVKLSKRFASGFLRNWEFSLGYLFSSIMDAGRTDKLYDQNSLQIYDNRDHLAYFRLGGTLPGLATTAGMTLSFQDFFEQKDTHKVKNDYATISKTTRDNTSARTVGVDINLSTVLKADCWRLNYGGMYYRDSVSAERSASTPGSPWIGDSAQDYPDGSTFANFGVYAMLEWDLWRNAGNIFRLSGGWRHHGVSSHVPERIGLPEVRFSFSGDVFLVSCQFLAGERLNLSLTYSQGFRAPNLSEAAMLGDTGQYFHIPNYQLRPENSNTIELAAQGRTGTLTVSTSGYISFLNDFIKRDNTVWSGQTKINGKAVVHNVNAGEGVMWGVESRFLWGLTGNISLSGNLTWTWGEERIPQALNVPLTRIPPLFGSLKARYDFIRHGRSAGFIEGYARSVARQERLSPEDLKDSRIPKGGTPGWTTLNFRLGTVLWEHIRCVLDVENVFDKKYKYHGSGIYNPGLGIVLTLEIF